MLQSMGKICEAQLIIFCSFWRCLLQNLIFKLDCIPSLDPLRSSGHVCSSHFLAQLQDQSPKHTKFRPLPGQNPIHVEAAYKELLYVLTPEPYRPAPRKCISARSALVVLEVLLGFAGLISSFSYE